MSLHVPVLIVGAGPIGLMAGLLLEQQGIDYRIVERRPTLHQAPQAHVVSSRTLEICRSVGIDDAIVRQQGPRLEDQTVIRWVDRLIGRDIGVLDMTPDPETLAQPPLHSPTPTTNLSQDRFESILHGHLPDPDKVLFSHTWCGFEPSADGVVSTITAGDSVVEISSRYVLAADGAGSSVRKAVGIDMAGPDNLQLYVSIHFRANLRDQLAGREALLYWVMDEAVDGTFVAHDIDSTWVFMKTVPEDEPVDQLDESKFADLLRAAIGAEVEMEIVGMKPWRMTAQIAEAYRKEHVFLVGDAAHRFPPTGGLGMNTGMQDVFNLIWKIAMVERGFDHALLDTYETERKPIAHANSDQSMTNAMKMFEVLAALDVDGDHRITPDDIEAVLSDPARLALVQAAIDAQAEHFAFDGLDLGCCYGPSIVVTDDGGPAAPVQAVAEYLPSTTPGARMPHAPLRRDGAIISTLDLVRHDAFLLLAHADAPVVDGLDSHLEQLDLPAVVVRVGDEGDLVPADGRFAALFAADDLLVVRPDGHLGARLPASSPLAEITRSLTALLPSVHA
ncbi:MAG: FAD-dependent monooxygenase [Acidimicrobiales bacterium]